MAHILCNTFNINKLGFTPAMQTDMIQAMLISFPNYNSKPFIFETSEIVMTYGGIPKLGTFYTSDADRKFMHVPLDPTQNGCMELNNMLSQVETYFDHNHKSLIAGTPAHKLKDTYQPVSIIKEKNLDVVDDDDDAKSKKNQFNNDKKWCVFKFKTNYNTGIITTKIFINENDQIKPVNVQTVTDIEQHLTWGSTFRAIVHMDKAWYAKTKKNTQSQHRDCGITFKILQLEITPKKQVVTLDKLYSKYGFTNKNLISNDKPEDSEIDDELEIEI